MQIAKTRVLQSFKEDGVKSLEQYNVNIYIFIIFKRRNFFLFNPFLYKLERP